MPKSSARMAGTVHFELAGPVATLTLDHAAKRNSIDLAMAGALAAAAGAIAADARVRAVVVRGAGERAFCAGGDFDAMTAGGALAEAMAAMEKALDAAMAALDAIEVPIVAAINGSCFGAGVQLALAADVRLAADDARFGIPAATLGIVYPLPAIAEMVRLAGPGAAAHLLLGAEPLDAKGALAKGLVDEVVAKAELAAAAAAHAARIASHPSETARAYKAIIRGLARGRPVAELREIQRRAHAGPGMVERLAEIAKKRAAKT
jgi:enoyl-CoA hydratase/carnithine racemase